MEEGQDPPGVADVKEDGENKSDEEEEDAGGDETNPASADAVLGMIKKLKGREVRKARVTPSMCQWLIKCRPRVDRTNGRPRVDQG